MGTRWQTRLSDRSRGRIPARAAVAVLVGLTAFASAITAQGRSRGGGSPNQSAPARPTVAPVLWEPEQIFPLAIARASELKLSDEQRTKIETINAKLRASNQPLLESIDTLRPPRLQLPTPGGSASSTPTPIPPPPTAEELAAIVARRHALTEARAQVHENIRLARDELTQLMTPEQQTRLVALETSARNDAERGDRGGTAPDRSLTGARAGQRRGQQGPPSR